MNPAQVLAVIRIREWACDRQSLSAGRTTDYRRVGYRERRQREADSRIVRVLDFERALATLAPVEQAALMLAFRDSHSRHGVAVTLGCCTRTASTLTASALSHLAATLGRLDLL